MGIIHCPVTLVCRLFVDLIANASVDLNPLVSHAFTMGAFPSPSLWRAACSLTCDL